MNNLLLVKVLYAFFVLSFWMMLTAGFVNIGFDLFSKDGKLVNEWGISHHSKGFALPVQVQIQIPDSVVNYTGDVARSDHYYKSRYEDLTRHQKIDDSLKHLANVKRVVLENRAEIKPFKFDKEVLQLSQSTITSFGIAYAKSSNRTVSTTYQVVRYVGILLLVLILYQLKSIFSLLKKSLSFNVKIVKRVRWLGLILLGSQFFEAGLGYSLLKFNGSINIRSYENGSPIDVPFNLLINPTINFGWDIFLVGTSLLVLSSLLKAGNKMEVENSLTI